MKMRMKDNFRVSKKGFSQNLMHQRSNFRRLARKFIGGGGGGGVLSVVVVCRVSVCLFVE